MAIDWDDAAAKAATADSGQIVVHIGINFTRGDLERMNGDARHELAETLLDVRAEFFKIEANLSALSAKVCAMKSDAYG